MSVTLCGRGRWARVGSLLVVQDGTEWRNYDVLPTPLSALALWKQATAVAGLKCLPEFVWVQSAHGAGGFFSPGLVVIGQDDLDAIVNDVWTRYLRELSEYETLQLRLWSPGTKLITRNDVWNHALALIVFHELGHAHRSQRTIATWGIPEERAADRIAGQIAEILHSEPTIERLVLHSIGCRHAEELCTHPQPDARVSEYDAGRVMQVQARRRTFPAHPLQRYMMPMRRSASVIAR